MPHYLGLDLSTQSLTALLLDPDEDRVVGLHAFRFDDRFPEHGTADGVIREDDGSVVSPVTMFLDALDALFGDMRELGWPLGEVAGIALSAQQHATVYLDDTFDRRVGGLDAKEGLSSEIVPSLTRPVSPVWLDQSTASDIARMRERLRQAGLPADYVTTTTGSDYALRFPAAQIARFAHTQPAAYERTARIHLLSSFLTSVLAGRDGALDFGEGAGTNLLRLRDETWDDRLLEAAAPDLLQRLPPLACSTKSAGRVAPSLRRRYGLPAACTVLLGTGDNPSSLIGGGASRPGSVIVSLGTSDTVFAAVFGVPAGGVGHVFGNPAGGWMRLVCFTNGSLARERVRERCGVGWERASEILLASDLTDAEVLLPYLDDEISPPHAAVPLPDDFPLDQLLVSYCLGQTLNVYGQARACLGDVDTVLLTGGASSNNGLAQLYADVFQAPVERLEVTASAALGAAKRAWQGCTGLPWEQVDTCFRGVNPQRTRLPDPRRAEAILAHRSVFESRREAT